MSKLILGFYSEALASLQAPLTVWKTAFSAFLSLQLGRLQGDRERQKDASIHSMLPYRFLRTCSMNLAPRVITPLQGSWLIRTALMQTWPEEPRQQESK